LKCNRNRNRAKIFKRNRNRNRVKIFKRNRNRNRGKKYRLHISEKNIIELKITMLKT